MTPVLSEPPQSVKLNAMKTIVLPLLFIFFVACGSEGDSGPATPGPATPGPATPSSSGGNPTLEEAALRPPAMRNPIQCCADLKLEKGVRAYLDAGTQITNGALTAESLQELVGALGAITKGAEDFAPLLPQISELDVSDLPRVRQVYGDLSEVILPRIESSSSSSGDLDLAFGYSREFDRHWAQEGVEPKSPYGDGIHSYSWGKRQEVKNSDQAEEERLGNTNLGPTP